LDARTTASPDTACRAETPPQAISRQANQPAAMALIPVKPSTRTGTLVSTPLPSPSAPSPLCPFTGYWLVTLDYQRFRVPCAADGRPSSQVRPTREWTLSVRPPAQEGPRERSGRDLRLHLIGNGVHFSPHPGKLPCSRSCPTGSRRRPSLHSFASHSFCSELSC